MDPRFPISTDNIAKFAATFGLLLIFISSVLFVLNNQHANQVIIENYEKMLLIEGTDEQAQNQTKVYERQIEVAIENRSFYNAIIGLIMGFGAVLSWTGFGKWIKQVQPAYDAILKLEKEKLELEVAILKRQAGSDSPETGENSTAS